MTKYDEAVRKAEIEVFVAKAALIKAEMALAEAVSSRCYAAHLAAGGPRIYRRSGQELFAL